jgi:hypothetical protein
MVKKLCVVTGIRNITQPIRTPLNVKLNQNSLSLDTKIKGRKRDLLTKSESDFSNIVAQLLINYQKWTMYRRNEHFPILPITFGLIVAEVQDSWEAVLSLLQEALSRTSLRCFAPTLTSR